MPTSGSRGQLKLIELALVAPRAAASVIRSDTTKTHEERGVKSTPEIVAVSLVKRLMMAADEQHERDQHRADGHFAAADCRLSGTLHSRGDVRHLVAEHDHGKRIEHETPDHAKRVGFAEHESRCHGSARSSTICRMTIEVDQPIGRAEALVRLAEPVGQHAVFRHAVQYAVRSDDRRIHRAGEHQEPDDHDKRLEEQPQPERSDQFMASPEIRLS